MLGPLPRMHRLVIGGLVVATCLGLGVWMGVTPMVPVLVTSGALLGLLAGAVLAWVVVRDSHADPLRQQRPRT